MIRYTVGLLVALGAVLASPASAQEGWQIDRFASDIVIEADGVVSVQETITVDFGRQEKHGIIRELPYVYETDTGEPTYTRIDDIAVQQDGAPAEVDVTRASSYVAIRIGNPDVTITGRHEYVISYRAVGVLRSHDSFDELYWNVTGHGWDVPIAQAAARVTVPAEITQAACYQGPFGSTQPCRQVQLQSGAAEFSAEQLPPGSGLSAAVGFQSGIVPIVALQPPPTLIDALVSPTTVGVAAVVGLAGLLVLLRHWYRFGRDRMWQRSHLPGVRSDRAGKTLPEKILPLGSRRPVSVEYDAPDGLRPAEIGVLMDEKANTLDVSASIVDLAARGFLTITEVPKKWVFGKADYTFTRTEQAAAGLLPYEKMLLEKLFDDDTTVTMSALKNSFYKDLKKVKDSLYDEVVRKQLFAKRPDTMRTAYLTGGVILAAAGVGGLFLTAALLSQAAAAAASHHLLAGTATALIGFGAAMGLFSPLMPRKTGYGRELYERVRGYELFVSGTEKYRAKFYEDKGLFLEVLPYAIVFGVTDKLAKAFADMGIEPLQPAWFHGAAAWHAADFASSMNNFSDSVATAMASAPSSSGSSGGGFSGGGFGGGGGSSW